MSDEAPISRARHAVKVFAAGSLKAVVTEAAARLAGGTPPIILEIVFGATGLLRERIELGEAADVLLSADLAHPQALHERGLAAAPPQPFARNVMCLLVRPGLDLYPRDALDVMLDTDIRLGMSTPGTDPSGDYALAVFAKTGTVRAGARQALDAKASRLTGGRTTPKPGDGRNTYAALLEQGDCDVFLTYATNALSARQANAGIGMMALPDDIAIEAVYGLAVLAGAPPAAHDFAAWITGTDGAAMLRRHGFRPA